MSKLITANEARLKIVMLDDNVYDTISSIHHMIVNACDGGERSIYTSSESLFNNTDTKSKTIRKLLKDSGYGVISKHYVKESSSGNTFNSFGIEISW